MNDTLNYRSLWSLDPLSRRDVLKLIDTAYGLQRAAVAGALPQVLRGKNIALLSNEHTSPQALAFHRAASDLGAQVARIRAEDPGTVEQRDPRDTAGLLGRLYNAIECQDMPIERVRQMDRDAGVPVYNGIGSPAHPTRLLADLMFMQACSGTPLDGIRLSFVGDPGGAAAHAVRQIAGLTGIDLRFVDAVRAEWSGDAARGAAAEPGVALAVRTAFVCAPQADGRLPLVVRPVDVAPGRGAGPEPARNHRHLIQALLLSTM